MKKSNHIFHVTGLFFFLFFVYVLGITDTARLDESTTFLRYTHQIDDVIRYDLPNNHILHSFLVWLSTSILGDSLVAIRLPSFFAGMLSLVFIYRLGTKFVNHHVGLTSMLVLGIIASFFHYTTNARGYTLSILFTMIFIEIISYICNTQSKLKMVYIFILSVALILTVPSNAFFVVGILIWQILLAIYSARVDLAKFSIPIIFAIILSVIIYAILLYTSVLSTNGSQDIFQEFNFGFYNPNALLYATINLLFENPAISLILFVIFLGGLYVVMSNYRRQPFLIIICIILCSIVFTIIQWIITHKLFYPRNYLYLLPLIALIISIGIYQIFYFRLNLLLPVLLLVTGSYGLNEYRQLPTKERIWLAAINDNVQEGDQIFMGCCFFDPLYYHISVRGEMDFDYFSPSYEIDRYIFLSAEKEEFEELVNRYSLEDSIGQCTLETWNTNTVMICNSILLGS